MGILPNKPPQEYNIDDILILADNILIALLSVAGVIATIYIVIGAFQYFTAYGDESKAENGKKTLTWAIVGLVLIILARVAVGEIWRFFSGQTPSI